MVAVRKAVIRRGMRQQRARRTRPVPGQVHGHCAPHISGTFATTGCARNRYFSDVKHAATANFTDVNAYLAGEPRGGTCPDR